MLKTAILTGLMLLATPAHACYSLGNLDQETESCSDNGRYVDAGIQCFLTFENAVKKNAGFASTQMQNSNKKHVLGDKNSQTSGMIGMSSDFKISEKTLDALISAGKNTLQSLDGYSKNIFFPEEWDAPSSIIGNGLEYLNSSPCYAEPRDMLQDMKERTEKYIAELENAKEAVTAMRGTTEQRNVNLDATTPNAPARAPASLGKSAPVVKKGHSVNPRSTITGVEEDKNKRAK